MPRNNSIPCRSKFDFRPKIVPQVSVKLNLSGRCTKFSAMSVLIKHSDQMPPTRPISRPKTSIRGARLYANVLMLGGPNKVYMLSVQEADKPRGWIAWIPFPESVSAMFVLFCFDNL